VDKGLLIHDSYATFRRFFDTNWRGIEPFRREIFCTGMIISVLHPRAFWRLNVAFQVWRKRSVALSNFNDDRGRQRS
jgi:hypothetical protein